MDFEGLVDLHYQSLYRFALSLTRSESDSCDLVQETFLAWAAKGSQLRDRSKVKSWLFTTLHRGFLQRQRHHLRFPHVEIAAADLQQELPEIEPELARRLDAQRVLDLLGQVPPPLRAAVALFYLEDHSYLEIAEILEVPLGTVKSRIARGLAHLRELVLHAAPRQPGSKEGSL
jgi:RNA polymerase sigma-70 factor (ECF subfamily)